MKTELLKPNEEDILKAAQCILEGQTVGMPTETVYGLAGNCFDEAAVSRIFQAKERPTFDPLIVHVSPGLLKNTGATSKVEALNRLGLLDALSLSETSRKHLEILVHLFWPGPLTIIVPKLSKVPDLVTAGLPKVGIRMPKHPVALKLIDTCGVPLAAPSANRFGRISPTEADHVKKELDGRIAAILDGGPCEVGVESTVLNLEPLTLLRPGAISAHQISESLNEIVHPPGSSRQASSSIHLAAPGQLASHYAPKKPLALLPIGFFESGKTGTDFLKLVNEKLEQRNLNPSAPFGLLLWDGRQKSKFIELFQSVGIPGPAETEILSESGMIEEAAKNLFKSMRRLDDAPRVQWILADSCPHPTGLGHAISDRLSRAAF